jgi:hypothetical protein
MTTTDDDNGRRHERHAVLVKRHELAEGFRGELLGEDRVRGTVSLKDPVGT